MMRGDQLTKRQYVHTTTTYFYYYNDNFCYYYFYCTATFISSATTIKAEDIKVKIPGNLEGEFELNRNIQCAYQLSKEHISNSVLS